MTIDTCRTTPNPEPPPDQTAVLTVYCLQTGNVVLQERVRHEPVSEPPRDAWMEANE